MVLKGCRAETEPGAGSENENHCLDTAENKIHLSRPLQEPFLKGSSPSPYPGTSVVASSTAFWAAWPVRETSPSQVTIVLRVKSRVKSHEGEDGD